MSNVMHAQAQQPQNNPPGISVTNEIVKLRSSHRKKLGVLGRFGKWQPYCHPSRDLRVGIFEPAPSFRNALF